MNVDFGAEARELKIQKRNRKLGIFLAVFVLLLALASFALMKIFDFVPTPPN